MPLSRTLVVIGISAALGCGGTEPNSCLAGLAPGVVVEVRDAFDGASLAATARGAVHEGAYVDSLRPYGFLGNGALISLSAADERAGTYTVTVEHDGYAAVSRSGVQVRPGVCHVVTAYLSFYLYAAP